MSTTPRLLKDLAKASPTSVEMGDGGIVMPYSAASKQPPTVFISYAHESDALRASVATLAEWLGRHGCRVLTDHPYVDRPPPEGWQAWMLGCIDQNRCTVRNSNPPR